MKKKQKKQQICIDTVLKQKISTLYLGFMMVAFSLYYQDAFFNIAQAKRGIYIWSTIVYIILMLLFSIYSLTRDFKGILKAKKDLVGILIVLLIVSWAIGMFFAVNPKESFLGEYNKCTGLVMYLVGILAMIYLSKYLEWKIELIWSFLFATGLVYFQQIINRFN